ncbi:corticotropin-releasing factor-binding protein-like [Corythoichthys intestinalis]|uniref:corticotropin-releasing factor-binding protein-like n=1 Tax=Corythoichthys intestinalis TaxID=161448 RepID=UPI0025A5582D|nr:corticotropin-releasing factor-binding protein-like [Corythoichthys intestinalis]XP_061804620.1 corticotropin-releasing factor-binding protein-like [Nerophis lumbriciformis]
MSLSMRAQHLLLLLLSLSSHMILSRYIRDDDNTSAGSYPLLSLEQKRESADFIFRRTLRCLDMLATEGHFTFTVAVPQQLLCATFIISEPGEVISLELSDVNIDCNAGDFIKIFDGWVLKGEKFPSSQDHPLPLHRRYTDICSSTVPGHAIRSSQNVAMVFFRIRSPNSGFTLIVKKLHNPFPCNIMSQSPEGSFTMVMPYQNRNCSFSIIYPVEIQVTQLTLEQDQSNQLRPMVRPSSGCLGSGDYVELLGGNGVDTSHMFPVAELCFPLSAPAQMKIGCDNSVVRLVSSGNYINRVSFRYRLLQRNELPETHENSLDNMCNVE